MRNGPSFSWGPGCSHTHLTCNVLITQTSISFPPLGRVEISIRILWWKKTFLSLEITWSLHSDWPEAKRAVIMAKPSTTRLCNAVLQCWCFSSAAYPLNRVPHCFTFSCSWVPIAPLPHLASPSPEAPPFLSSFFNTLASTAHHSAGPLKQGWPCSLPPCGDTAGQNILTRGNWLTPSHPRITSPNYQRLT